MVPHYFMRVKFAKGKQRYFIKRVLEATGCPSLRSLNERGFEVSYSTLKNYYSEVSLLPEEFFKNLCTFSKINPDSLKVTLLPENWGQLKKRKYFMG